MPDLILSFGAAVAPVCRVLSLPRPQEAFVGEYDQPSDPLATPVHMCRLELHLYVWLSSPLSRSGVASKLCKSLPGLLAVCFSGAALEWGKLDGVDLQENVSGSLGWALGRNCCPPALNLLFLEKSPEDPSPSSVHSEINKSSSCILQAFFKMLLLCCISAGLFVMVAL